MPAAIDPVGALKLLFNLTITPIPAAVKSAFSGSSCHPITRKCSELVVARVLTPKVAEDIPVAVVPLVAVAKLAFKKTEALVFALIVYDASDAIKN